jgi:hypothetical protein
VRIQHSGVDGSSCVSFRRLKGRVKTEMKNLVAGKSCHGPAANVMRVEQKEETLLPLGVELLA